MKVPLLDLKPHHDPIQPALIAAFERVMRSQMFILGPEVEALERRIASYCQTEFAIGTSSGTDALLLALMALEIGPGDEVITTPYSFFASAGVVARLGARPVFVDIDPLTYNMDANRVEAAVTARTRVIMPVHLFGQCADVAPLLKIAEAHALRVVEDAAQAIGAEHADGRRAGSVGAFGCLSFFPSKNLGALGDAGMVLTNDPELAERARVLRVHGSKPKYHHHFIGGNFRLDALQAAMLAVKLDHLDGWTRARQAHAQLYVRLLEARGLVTDGSVTPPPAPSRGLDRPGHHIYNQFVIRARRRDALQKFLAEHDVGTEVYYPVPFHQQPCFQYLGYKDGDFPEAERAARETLALPVYPELTSEQQIYVMDTIREFYSHG